MIENSELVENTGFPDPLVSDEKKNSKDYILQWAKAITHEWFSRNENQESSRFLTQKNDFHQRVLYARGEHPTEYINETLNEGDEEAYANFDERPIQVLPRFINIMVNAAYDRLFKVRAEATDKFSTDMRDKYREVLEDLMLSKDMLQEAKELHNVDLNSGGEVPETQEEIEVHMRSKFKLGIEKATEKLIRYTLDINDYEESIKKVLWDLIVYGLSAVKHHTDLSKGIMVERADVADMVWSFPEDRKFSNVYYYGHLKRMTITELMRISNLQLPEDKIKELGQVQERWASFMGYSNARTERDEDINHQMVDVLFFTFKAYNTINYKKKYKPGNRISMIKKDDTFKKPDPSYKGYDAIKKVYDVWYKGAVVMGTDHLFNYGLCENMIRPEGVLNRTVPEYILYGLDPYQGRFRSPVSSVKLYIDQMQQVHVKLQQMIAKARPAGVAIDVHGLSEVVMGKGGEILTPLELQKIYDQTGNVYYSSVDEDGSINYNRQPIQELANGVIRGLPELISSYNHYLELVRSTLGVPQGVDATLPDERTLVGVQKLAAASANTATRHILDGALNMTKTLGSAIGLRMKDIFKYSHLKEAYINAIGKIDMKLLESIKDFHLHDLSIIIKLLPDAEDRERLNRRIEIALERDQIGLDDAGEIEDIAKEDTKLANDVLRIRISKRERKKREHEENQIRLNAEENGKAAERAAQAKIQEIQAVEQEKRITMVEELKQKMQLITHEKQSKAELMEQEAIYKIILEGTKAEAKGIFDLEREKMRAKGQLQKAEGKISGSFESSEDQISGSIEMGEMEPS